MLVGNQQFSPLYKLYIWVVVFSDGFDIAKLKNIVGKGKNVGIC